MKHSEEAIEKVLAGLRDADAPAGMERRILDSLDALQDQASGRSRLGWRQVLPIWLVMPGSPAVRRSVACGVALVGVFALALAIPAIRRLGHGPVQSKVSIAPVELMPAVNSEAVASDDGARSVQVSPPSRRGPNVRPMVRVDAQKVTVGVVDDSEALALQEFRAASQPAPPMPLTEQEKLLLRIAHQGAPEELAALSPLRRAARDEEEKAEVQRFFEPKTTQNNE